MIDFNNVNAPKPVAKPVTVHEPVRQTFYEMRITKTIAGVAGSKVYTKLFTTKEKAIEAARATAEERMAELKKKKIWVHGEMLIGTHPGEYGISYDWNKVNNRFSTSVWHKHVYA